MGTRFQSVTFEHVLLSVVEPDLGGRKLEDVPFELGWHAGVLYRDGWDFVVEGEPPTWTTGTEAPGDYAVVAVREADMVPYEPPADVVLEFANLGMPLKKKEVEISLAISESVRDLVGTEPAPTYQVVRPDLVRRFLERYGPLSDSFLRNGEDPQSEMERNRSRDPRGERWQYCFNRAVRWIHRVFDESGPDRDEATRIAWLLLDEAPQFTLLKVLALQAFSRMIKGKNMTRCGDPSCQRFFEHKRTNASWCSPECGNRMRVRNWRAKKSRQGGTSDG